MRMISLIKADLREQYLPEEVRQWRALQVFNIYRVCVSIILMLVYFFGIGPISFAQHPSFLVTFIIFLYLLFSLANFFVTYHQYATLTVQTVVQVVIDITIFSLLIWSSEGVAYGFGILINAAIAGGSIITAGRISLLFAAYGSIAVLVQRIFSDPNALFATTGYTETGILGATFFATAILGYGLSHRIRTSEALASQRGIDLAKLEKVNELIIQRMRSGVLVIDEYDRVRFMNDSAWYLLGIPMRAGPQFIGELSPALMAQLRDWQRNPSQHVTATQSAVSGHGVMTQFAPIGSVAKDKKFATIVFLEDAAHLAQKAQQMKLASLGRLTASIAHEIRNPLSAVSHAAQLLAESPELSEKNIRLTEIIRKQSARMNNVIENILQLSRRKQAAPKVLNLKHWLEEFISHFKAHSQDELLISISVDPEDLQLFVDVSQLQQVLTNLCENGLHYSQLKTGEQRIELIAGLTGNNNEPFLEVIDHGEGVDIDKSEYIFEPFYTTKKSGTGLGLYIAKELCEANQAHLSYYPLEQGGSCFRITFRNPMESQSNL